MLFEFVGKGDFRRSIIGEMIVPFAYTFSQVTSNATKRGGWTRAESFGREFAGQIRCNRGARGAKKVLGLCRAFCHQSDHHLQEAVSHFGQEHRSSLPTLASDWNGKTFRHAANSYCEVRSPSKAENSFWYADLRKNQEYFLLRCCSCVWCFGLSRVSPLLL